MRSAERGQAGCSANTRTSVLAAVHQVVLEVDDQRASRRAGEQLDVLVVAQQQPL